MELYGTPIKVEKKQINWRSDLGKTWKFKSEKVTNIYHIWWDSWIKIFILNTVSKCNITLTFVNLRSINSVLNNKNEETEQIKRQRTQICRFIDKNSCLERITI